MKKSKINLIFMVSILILAGILLNLNLVSAEANVCCEKLVVNADGSGGQWCQNAPVESCDTSVNPLTNQKYQAAPTSCESTTFCSTGTCFDSQEGVCEEGVSQNVCNSGGGVWDEKSAVDLPQCGLGCCTLGDGASFVTQSRCKKLSSVYGVQTNFNQGIGSEIECIASAGGDEKGACVLERGAERTCKLLTNSECNTMKGNSENSNVDFFEGVLCSDENLGTNCGPTTKKSTTCIEGQNEVYFVDSCGNLANIYDSTKINDKSYWSKIIPKEESCGYGSSNADSKSCGNCDYYRGSTCGEYERGETAKPNYGDYICKDLGCEYKGVKYEHGESWCGEAPGTAKITDPNQDGNYKFDGKDFPDYKKTSLPGSVYTKLTCYNGEVDVENCYDSRQKVCVQSEINGFKNAACKLNSWQDCYDQKSEGDCLNRELRDCKWEPTEPITKIAVGCLSKDPKACYNEELGIQKTEYVQKGYCAPIFSPGFDFWKGDGNGDAICSLGSISCDYEIKDKLLSSKYVEDGEECINPNGIPKQEWINAMQNRCVQIGDCGKKDNYLGFAGEAKTFFEKIIAPEE